MQTPEEMLDIFLEETGKQREDILSYVRMKKIDFGIFNKPVCLKRYALFVSYKNGFLIKERVHVSDRYDLVIDDGKFIPKSVGFQQKEPQRTYFKEALDYYQKSDIQYNSYYTSSLTIWNHIRSLVYSYYGVKTLQQMKFEWQDEANKLAVEFMKLLEKKGDK